MLSELVFLLIEEGVNNNMIRMVLENQGYSESQIDNIIFAAGIGQERKKLVSWSRKRYNEARK